VIPAFTYRRLATVALILSCLAPRAASAQPVMAHMEACLEWGDLDGHFGAVNICNKPTTVLFMTLADEHVTEQEVAPGGSFNSGAPKPVGLDAWMFTACPVGYVPSVRFSAANANVILPSLYNCQQQGRPGA
jgi:hypothetical protein